MNHKLTQNFNNNNNVVIPSYQEACLLNAKGRVVDLLGVAIVANDQTYLFSSMGHTSLGEKLQAFVFPMDQVQVELPAAFGFSLASTHAQNVQQTLDQFVAPRLGRTHIPLSPNRLLLDNQDNTTSGVLITPTLGIPTCIGVAYTLTFLGTCKGLGEEIWQHLVRDTPTNGPIPIGALEVETLRIEAGMVRYNYEIKDSKDATATATTPANPLELGLEHTINFSKGCYLGQEGVASVAKNPRGPPRSLYQVVFDDEFNFNESENEDNLPKVGDPLFVLGSNEEIAVGTITSLAEPGGTGQPVTLALALVRRADSILKQMKDKEIDLPRTAPLKISETDESGIIQPPALYEDPLEGLEVIVGGTYTVGRLQPVPWRKYGQRNMFSDEPIQFDTNPTRMVTSFEEYERIPGPKVLNVFMEDSGATPVDEKVSTGEDSEAKRKAEKMELLRQRAAEATARRKEMKQRASTQTTASPSKDNVEAEARRKAEKMEKLRQQAEEALARRRQKKEQSDQ